VTTYDIDKVMQAMDAGPNTLNPDPIPEFTVPKEFTVPSKKPLTVRG
jgi:hypothetical protein